MPIPQPLPRTLFAELGKLVVCWANIEQDLILHASAMAAYSTDGKPIEYLRMDFKRLRQKWFSLCRERFDADIMDKVVNPLNSALSKYAPWRGYCVHGMWYPVRRGVYLLLIFEQKDAGLQSYRAEMTLAEIRATVSESYLLAKEVHRFATGKHHRFKNKRATVAKIPVALVPGDKG